jgi:hypothetical protein
MTRASDGPYPVGAPYRPQDDSAVRAAQLKYWTFALIGAAGLMLVVTVGGGVFWLNLVGRDPDQEAAAEQPPAASAPPATGADRADPLLSALGALSGANLYQSSVNLGLLADGVESKAYTKAEGEAMLARTLGVLDEVDRQFGKLKEARIDPEERQPIERIQKLSQLLRAQAEALRAYWKTDGATEEARYVAARREAMAALAALATKK